MKIYLNEEQRLQIAKAYKIHHLVAIENWQDSKTITFFEDEELTKQWGEDFEIKATQDVFMAIDPQGVFLIMIDNRILDGEESNCLAKCEGYRNTHHLFMELEPQFKKHQFYKIALEFKLIHFLHNSRYASFKSLNKTSN